MNQETFITNARIESVKLSLERGNFLTMWVFLNWGSAHQGFGGNVLCNTSFPSGVNDGACMYIAGILKALHVECIDELTGLICRVKKKGGEFSQSRIEAIGHPIDDDWFDLAEWAAKWVAPFEDEINRRHAELIAEDRKRWEEKVKD